MTVTDKLPDLTHENLRAWQKFVDAVDGMVDCLRCFSLRGSAPSGRCVLPWFYRRLVIVRAYSSAIT
jgi:hypothetical protein